MSSKSYFSKEAAEKITVGLKNALASTYMLYLKTQNFHWNVESPHFYSYHKMFEEQYEELAEAVDLLAERIRNFGKKAPASMQEFLKLSSLHESSSDLSSKEMIRILYEDHETLSDILLNRIQEVQEFGDEGTADIYIERIRAHDKAAWMLKSHLE